MDIAVPGFFQRPVIEGTTNLPDGTTVGVALACEDGPRLDCAMYDFARVEHGRFKVDLSAPQWAVRPGKYRLTVGTPFAFTQPRPVQAVIGQHGENLAGQYVTNGSLRGEQVVDFVREITIGSGSLP